MLRAVIICALFALAQCHESEENHEHAAEKHGHCPVVANNVTAAACATLCPLGANCTSVNCSSDTNCTGAQKCCHTGCGLECVDPEFKTNCNDDVDCPGTLICCKKSCVTVCVEQKPPKKYEWFHKGKREEDD